MTEQRLKYLFDEHRQSLIAYATSITKDYEAARDVVAESYVKLFYYDDVPEDKQYVFLKVIVRNGCYDYHKKELSFRDWLKQANEPTVCYQSHRDPNIAKAIEMLPAGQRVILKLRVIEGCEYKEIAQLLSVSIDTVRGAIAKSMHYIEQYFKTGIIKEKAKKSENYHHPGFTDKLAAIKRAIAEGMNYKSVMAKFGITAPTYYKYKRSLN